jgi:hypothetical protein
MTRRQYVGALVVLAASGLLGGALSTWLLPGQAAWAQDSVVQEVVKARAFILTGQGGEARAKLATVEDGRVGLFILDAAGKRRAELSVLAQGPDHEIEGFGWVAGTVEGTPVLTLHGDRQVASMSVGGEDGPHLMLVDTRGDRPLIWNAPPR